MYPLGMLLSLALIIVVLYGRELTIDHAQTLLITALGILIVFMGIILSWVCTYLNAIATDNLTVLGATYNAQMSPSGATELPS
jgi:D-alanyl-lipoteichoic acid acyltransferase DltB (MBOAT superfamily)